MRWEECQVRDIAKLHASAPYWWRTGCIYYYSAVQETGNDFSFGVVRPDLAASARKYIDDRETPRLSKMLLDPARALRR